MNENPSKKIDDYMSKLNERLAKQEEDRNMVLGGTTYIEWLVTFSNMYKDFADDSWLYQENEISKEDRDNVFKLHILYSGIENYASRNYMYPNYENGSTFYRIQYNGYGFEIGTIHGQDVLFYCSRVDVTDENENDFINFNDILNDKVQDNVPMVNNFLTYLNGMIDTAINNGVPVQAISQSLTKKLNSVSHSELINKRKNTK